MSNKYYEVTQKDLKFYNMYELWYYCLGGAYTSEQGCEVGDLFSFEGELAIISGLSGIHRYLYIMRWNKQSHRYSVRGCNQSELAKVCKDDFINTRAYQELYKAHVDWLRLNDFQICTAHFHENWDKYKAGKITEMELAYMSYKDKKNNKNDSYIANLIKNTFKLISSFTSRKKGIKL